MSAFEIDFKKDKKRRAIIICEGTSDVAFISLYLESKLGFEFNREKTGVPRLGDKKTHLYHYSNNDFDLSIYSAGGSKRIHLVFENYINSEIMFSDYEDLVIVIIADADENNKKDIIKEVENNIFDFELDNVLKNSYENSSGNKHTYSSFLRIIPLNENGVFENVLIKALETKEPYICKSVSEFYENMNNQTKANITKKRLFLKSKLNCILNLIDPTKMFDELSSRFSDIDTSAEEICKNYGFLIELLGTKNE